MFSDSVCRADINLWFNIIYSLKMLKADSFRTREGIYKHSPLLLHRIAANNHHTGLAQSLNNKLQVDMIYIILIMDFSKAFDTVPHNRLLNKLNRYGIRNKTHNWISNFLKYRKQRIVIGGEHWRTLHMDTSDKSFQVYLKGQYSARYFFSLTLMICRIISIRQSACLQMTVY